jgi:hypothetical protein
MSPAGLAKAFAALAAAVLAISVGFAMAGAWLVLPFASPAGDIEQWCFTGYAKVSHPESESQGMRLKTRTVFESGSRARPFHA